MEKIAEKIISSRLPENEFANFHKIAEINGTSVYKLLRQWSRDYLSKNSQQNKTLKSQKQPESIG